MLPDFLIIGAMKAGTTSLWRYLRSHPQVFMPVIKEPHFFSENHKWRLGITWYEEQFAEAPDGIVAVGEASSSYSKYPQFRGVPDRIAQCLPGARFIYLVRHPIDRMRSQYLHHVALGRERKRIERALLSNPTYLNNSLYAWQLAQYRGQFPRERFLVITSEALRDDRVETMRRVHRFLGLDEGWKAPNLDQEFYQTRERRALRPPVRTLRGVPGVGVLTRLAPRSLQSVKRRLITKKLPGDRATISSWLRLRLEEMLRDDVRQLRTYLGEDFDGWGIR